MKPTIEEFIAVLRRGTTIRKGEKYVVGDVRIKRVGGDVRISLIWKSDFIGDEFGSTNQYPVDAFDQEQADSD